MPRWLKKIVTVLITVMTLGTYIPPAYTNVDAEENKASVDSKVSDVQGNESGIQPTDPEFITSLDAELDTVDADISSKEKDASLQEIMEKAKEQTLTKMGPKIAGQLEDDFLTIILPNMERVLQGLASSNEDGAASFAITEKPSPGEGERIFHVTNHHTNQDIAHFHVRREHRPQEGFWFTFHYHMSNDNFEKHHEIGELYWDKNDPPRWMA